MNKIQELIKQLCPNGVEWKTLGEVCVKICSGGTPNSKTSEYYGGNIPWLRTQEVDFCEIHKTGMTITQDGLNNSSAKWIPANCVIVAMYGATVGKICINKIPLTTNQACCNLEINSEIALYKYVFYFLHSQYEYIKSLGEGSQTNINAQTVKNLSIPVPPLPIQTEIVNILDKFVEQQEQLEKLIELRKKQYEWYREEMLTAKEGWETKTLGEVFTVQNGYTPSKADASFWNGGTIPWFRMEDIRANGRKLNDSIQHITSSAVKNGRLFKSGSLIISTTATIGEYALIDCNFLCNQQITCLSPLSNDVDIRFYFHYASVIGEWCKKNVNGSGLAIVPTSKLKGLEIPVPPLPIQTEIVNILDKFVEQQEQLTSALELSKKRYEYYRDEMLRF